MRALNENEVKQVNGAWLQVAVFVVKTLWTGYRYYKSVQTANMAVQAATHIGAASSLVGATYTAASILGPTKP